MTSLLPTSESAADRPTFVEPDWTMLDQSIYQSALYAARPSSAFVGRHSAPAEQYFAVEAHATEPSYYDVSMPEPPYVEPPSYDVSTNDQPPRTSRRGLLVSIAAGITLALAALGVAASTGVLGGSDVVARGGEFTAAPTAIESALRSCVVTANSGVRVGDSGRSVTLDHQGQDEPNGLTFTQLFCVLNGLDVPDSVIAEMEQTRALDGRLTASPDGMSLSWTYHPDDGLDVVLSLTD